MISLESLVGRGLRCMRIRRGKGEDSTHFHLSWLPSVAFVSGSGTTDDGFQKGGEEEGNGGCLCVLE